MRDLLPLHRRFVAELLSDPKRCQYKAYRRVYGEHVKMESASGNATAILQRPEVAAAMEAAETEILGRLELTATDVLRVLFNVVATDTNELCEWVIGCCRYCHGTNFEYVRTPAEFRKDMAEYLRNPLNKRNDPLALEFPIMGGVGYDRRKDPHPDCPECNGEGAGRQILKDTRYLSEGARMLYNGVRKGKHGVEVMTVSKDRAIELAAKHTGVAKENVNMNANLSGGVTFYIPDNGRDPTPQES